MHPDDVADCIGGELGRLREETAQAPELNVGAVDLENDVDLYVQFTKVERPRLRADVQAGVLGPGGAQIRQVFEGIDLSASATSRRDLLLYSNCTGYDGDPPTAELLLPDRTPLPRQQWPQGLIRRGIVDGHRDYDRPFFCRPGLREYHTHPQHEDDPWDLHRESLRLHRIVLALLDELQHRWVLSS
jgi:putative metal binding uncharacterized protein